MKRKGGITLMMTKFLTAAVIGLAIGLALPGIGALIAGPVALAVAVSGE